ncbi:hypothetical protein FGO68_gene7203 [Halteria grandinella]|uniref:Uncharacterized protein n=1 Tax=Halteria grandinella TaxID=5974 RepID=A0A8J8SXQ2_HALGN|nr:hypothetical protein FGO68_gene7203 [Halteria grandinella]
MKSTQLQVTDMPVQHVIQKRNHSGYSITPQPQDRRQNSASNQPHSTKVNVPVALALSMRVKPNDTREQQQYALQIEEAVEDEDEPYIFDQRKMVTDPNPMVYPIDNYMISDRRPQSQYNAEYEPNRILEVFVKMVNFPKAPGISQSAFTHNINNIIKEQKGSTLNNQVDGVDDIGQQNLRLSIQRRNSSINRQHSKAENIRQQQLPLKPTLSKGIIQVGANVGQQSMPISIDQHHFSANQGTPAFMTFVEGSSKQILISRLRKSSQTPQGQGVTLAKLSQQKSSQYNRDNSPENQLTYPQGDFGPAPGAQREPRHGNHHYMIYQSEQAQNYVENEIDDAEDDESIEGKESRLQVSMLNNNIKKRTNSKSLKTQNQAAKESLDVNLMNPSQDRKIQNLFDKVFPEPHGFVIKKSDGIKEVNIDLNNIPQNINHQINSQFQRKTGKLIAIQDNHAPKLQSTPVGGGQDYNGV